MNLHVLTVAQAIAGSVAMLLLLVQLAIFRSVVVSEVIRLYAVQSMLVAIICMAVGVTEHAWDLIALAGLTIVLKVFFLPTYMYSLVRTISSRIELPTRVNVMLSLLIATALIAFSMMVASRLPLHVGAFLPQADLATTLSIVFVGFLVAILRPNALAQVLAFLTIENGLFFGTITLAPGLPFVIGVLLLIDVLVAVAVFATLVRTLVEQRATATVEPFQRLSG